MISFEGRALSVRKITLNDGKNTAGIDKIIWSTSYSKYKV
jgi:RNA-directed DNA polymerase